MLLTGIGPQIEKNTFGGEDGFGALPPEDEPTNVAISETAVPGVTGLASVEDGVVVNPDVHSPSVPAV